MLHRFIPAFIGCLSFLLATLPPSPFASGQTTGTSPVVGLRENPMETYLLTDASVVIQPGQMLSGASVLIRGTSIIDVGESIEPPADAKVIDCSGKTIYAGLIDGYSEIEVDEPADDGVGHWNGNVMPRRDTAAAIGSLSGFDTLRSQGVTMQLIAPRGGIFKGTSCLVMFDSEDKPSLVKSNVAQHMQLTVPRDTRRDSYPNSPMGAVALVRQTLLDAQWYRDAWKAYQSKPTLGRPERDDDLDRIATDRDSKLFIVDAQNERMAIRAETIAREFSLNIAIRGSGREYREAAAIADSDRVLLIPVDFPDAPDVSSEVDAETVELRELMHWYFAPENAARLVKAGAKVCLTSDGLSGGKSFLENVRTAVQHGLSPDDALASLTTIPASWMGIEDIGGRVQAGALANLVITDGELFDEETEILETWVAGKRFEQSAAAKQTTDAIEGEWTTTMEVEGEAIPLTLALTSSKGQLSGKLLGETIDDQDDDDDDESESDEDDDDDEEEPKSTSAKLEKLARAVDRLTAWVDLSDVDERLPAGPSKLTLVTLDSDSELTVFATLTFPNGQLQRIAWERAESPEEDEPEAEPEDEEDDEPEDEPEDEENDEDEDDDDQDEVSDDIALSTPLTITSPLGAYGVTEPIKAVDAILFRGATVWTCSEQGVLAEADVLVVDGKIDSIAESIEAPEGCTIIDATGKHLSPGLIDCHSHMATDGGVNESGQAITAEVRIGDFIDNSDVNIYRQLAGGLTMANVLHGSANPIGGQNQVVKLRWGDSMQAMKVPAAPFGIKFALGENVKRSNRSSFPTRYPGSRMGVEQIIRDRFIAAREYDEKFARFQAGNLDDLPPRRDLELEALAEILRKERWIHCHSYRQDEIIALLDLLDEFNVTIGTLQHILEGYKVADRLLEHGAMASAFSDWWAYKFEVYDAIPDNGAIMHEVGIVVSFNSDDRELARHLNTEAAKAVKYGGVPAAEALKFVTLNPAKQLRIDDRVGSIEPGKDADLVVWSGPPLSTLSRCEQTWVDGRPMFSLESDQKLRQRDAQWRSFLVSQVLAGRSETKSGGPKEISEEERWLRYDEFCHGHNEQRHDNASHRGHRH